MIFTKNRKSTPEGLPEWLTIDSNAHILPGIMAGKESLDAMGRLVRQLSDLGLKKIVCTAPVSEDQQHTSYNITQTYELLCQEMQQIDTELLLAGIYRIDKGFMPLLLQEKLMALPGGYILLDLPLDAEPFFIENTIFELEIKGLKPIIAHPERYTYYQDNQKRYQKLKKLGCLFQLSLLSLTGHYGVKVKRMALKLLKDGMIDLIGSGMYAEHQLQELREFVSSGRAQVLFNHYFLKNAAVFGE